MQGDKYAILKSLPLIYLNKKLSMAKKSNMYILYVLRENKVNGIKKYFTVIIPSFSCFFSRNCTSSGFCCGPFCTFCLIISYKYILQLIYILKPVYYKRFLFEKVVPLLVFVLGPFPDLPLIASNVLLSFLQYGHGTVTQDGHGTGTQVRGEVKAAGDGGHGGHRHWREGARHARVHHRQGRTHTGRGQLTVVLVRCFFCFC